MRVHILEVSATLNPQSRHRCTATGLVVFTICHRNPSTITVDRQIDERSTGWPVRRPASHAWAARRAGRCLTAPHADRAQLPLESERRLAHRHRHHLYPDQSAPYRADPAVGDPGAGHRPLQPFRSRSCAQAELDDPRLPCMPTHSSAIGKRRPMSRRCAIFIDCEARKRVPVQRLKAAGRRCSAAGWLDGSSREPANSFSRKVPGR
jgi:hypothetical protein